LAHLRGYLLNRSTPVIIETTGLEHLIPALTRWSSPGYLSSSLPDPVEVKRSTSSSFLYTFRGRAWPQQEQQKQSSGSLRASGLGQATEWVKVSPTVLFSELDNDEEQPAGPRYYLSRDISHFPALSRDVPALPELWLGEGELPYAQIGSEQPPQMKAGLLSRQLWLGPPGVHSPLHLDWQPNAFLQVLGCKTFRLFPAEAWRAARLHPEVLFAISSTVRP
jgi:hypothetical protein